jgi:ATP-dependent DNA helicase RecG
VTATLEQLDQWMNASEDEHLEFKEARNHFEFEELVKYCAALANEGGGSIILGVTDRRPRMVVGSQAFQDLERTKAGLVQRLSLRVEAEALRHPRGRVLAFSVPPRPLGMPIPYKGAYWMRAGQDLVPMTPDQLKRIFDETGPDFSAETCDRASLAELDAQAIQRFRTLWRRKSGNAALDALSDEQLLTDAELLVEGRVTYAALILLGTRQGLGKYLAQAELIFEYRSTEASGPAQQRVEHRVGALLFLDEIWNTINLRNDIQHFQDGLFIWDVPTFNEVAVREVVLNAVAHRDYRRVESVFIRQFPRRLEVISPGGFPPGITPENFLWRQAPRNRRVAEAFARCGLVERAGQGANRMFEESIKEGKRRPDLSGTDEYQVSVTLWGEVQDPRFLRFLEKVGAERVASFDTRDLLALDLVHREQPIPEDLRVRLAWLVDQGLVEQIGRGKGARFMLSRQFYSFLGQKGAYTRKRGLDRETNKALLLKHICDNERDGCQLQELRQVLPALSRRQVQDLLADLKSERRVYNTGRTNASRWYPGPSPTEETPRAGSSMKTVQE